MSGTSSRRLTVLCLASAALAGLALIVPTHPAKADKVGVAAAVKPDAYSEGKQVEIGNSVFYNQRIDTTGEGLVQVLLVDGSTFTVGPGSDLVIDKFVYDPSKEKGEVVASFSKGVMRFVGGKISKNEGGVTVNMPSGVLAIRGGMFQGTPSLFSFLFGVEMKFTGKNGQASRVYQPGYTLDLRGGAADVRPTTPEDTAFFMKSLSGGGKVVVAAPNGAKTNLGSNFLKKLSVTETQEEGTQTIIIGQLTNEEHHADNPPLPEPPSPPPSGGGTGGTLQGYAGGVYTQQSNADDAPVGSLASANPSDVAIVYNEQTHTFSGAKFVLFADQGGGTKIEFQPLGIFDQSSRALSSATDNSGGDTTEVPTGDLLFAGTADTNSISVYHETDSSSGEPQLTDPAHLNSGQATLVGTSGEALCQGCAFLKWGAWETHLNFNNHEGSEEPGQTNVHAVGFWVAGNMTSTAELGDLRNSGATASYAGTAIATVANRLNDNENWEIYVASGQMNMDWEFAKRKGNLEISQFDTPHIDGGLTFQGQMSTPGTLKNKFGGDLALTSPNILANLSDLRGFAQGSFVKETNNPAQGVIGNWNVGGANYGATGIFAGSKGGVPH